LQSARPIRSALLRVIPPLVLVAATIAIFSQTLHFDFVYDDYGQIVDTRQFDSWRNVPSFFTSHVWAWKTVGKPGVYYRPLFLTWLFVNHKLFGLNPKGWHATSLLMHLIVVLLVYLLARKLAGDESVGFAAALTFAVHPVHLESVAWVSGITDPLMAAPLLGSLLGHIRARSSGSRAWSYASWSLFGLSLLAKETSLVLPAFVLCYEWSFSPVASMPAQSVRVRLRSAFFHVLPFLEIVVVYLVVRWFVIHGFSTLITPIPRRYVLLSLPSVLLFYVRRLVWPGGLSVFYALPVVTEIGFQSVLLPGAILALLTAAAVVVCRKSRLVAFSLVLILFPLVPVLDLRLFAHNETVHDRYLYLPSVGFALLVALAIRAAASALSARRELLLRYALAGTLAIPLACLTVYQGQYWKDNLTLFERGVSIAPGNEIANQCMGSALLLQGNFALAANYYREALRINPRMFEANYSLGRAYYELETYPEAIQYFIRAIRLDPTQPRPFLYYGLAYMKQGQLGEAEAAVRHAMTLRAPDDFREYHASLGLVLERKGNTAEAIREFEAELQENPDSPDALIELQRLKYGNAPR
jgi:protein O-mannosyl-transferase